MFKPALGLKNKHLQTVYASLFRKPLTIDFRNEIFWLSDGDFVECYWYKLSSHNSKTPIVVLFHGLAGSYKSPYIQGITLALQKSGFSVVLMHFRGCGLKENLLPQAYHSGDTDDAFEFITHLTSKYPQSKLFAIGYSLGGNMLLKLLGEKRSLHLLSGAISVSAPMQLDVCANAINRGSAKFYQKLLLKNLNDLLYAKYLKHDMESIINITRKSVKKLKTFWEFDEVYTAKVNGFDSAQDYYTKCSAKQFLKFIQTPTLIIHSLDDPFMTPKILPTKEEMSKSVELEVSDNGGHVGFIEGSIFKPKYWLELRAVEYFSKLK